MTLNRRTFLAGTTALAANGMLAGPVLPNINLPRVGLGSWITFNVGNDQALLDRSAAVVEAFSQAGGGIIDSSPMYGSAQNTIGYALKKLGYPKNTFAADKVWVGDVDEGPEQIETSRANWTVETFDLLQVHNLVSWRGHLETLFEMKEAGKLKHVGITTSHGRRHGELEEIMASQPLDFVQLTYNIADREAEQRLLPLAQQRGMRVIVNRPFRRGALTKRLQGAALPSYAAELGAQSWAELLLKFVLSHPSAPYPIPATTSVEHVRQNKRAETGPMPDAALRERIATGRTCRHLSLSMETWLTYGLQDFVLFSPEVYFGLFRRANEAAWPFLLLFPVAGVFITRTVYAGRLQHIGGALLALAWVSTIFLFLRPYYLPINWAVTYAFYSFAAQVFFVLIAGIGPDKRQKSPIGYGLVTIAIIYPIIALLFGRPLNQTEIFALAPDPTAIFTLGYLLQFRGWQAAFAIPIPILWCAFSAITLYALGEPTALLPAVAAAIAVAAFVKRAVR